jgi:hypothetical protein
MPNRIIKESIWTSLNFNKLSPLAERHFYRILLSCDDWGCVEITPPILKGRCYPLAQDADEKIISTWNKELADNELIKIWEKDGRLYGEFVKFEEHNNLKERHNPKTPCPPWVSKGKPYDPRIASKTEEAYSRIEIAIKELGQNGHKPGYRDIAKKAECSHTTLKNYFELIYERDTTQERPK